MLKQQNDEIINNFKIKKMPNTGDSFITTLKQAHLEWGSYRHTNSKGIVIWRRLFTNTFKRIKTIEHN